MNHEPINYNELTKVPATEEDYMQCVALLITVNRSLLGSWIDQTDRPQQQFCASQRLNEATEATAAETAVETRTVITGSYTSSLRSI
ncbi:hypothetical protein CHARACLAT_002943 [Characodon lateralis]|uniref:Uncharacterized protein n=1 Tax=Characodon lateralis TaxID=208331 RepID=A0ABU7E772_9TELE|nr:hypothetical protein [Characodon lateralis]